MTETVYRLGRKEHFSSGTGLMPRVRSSLENKTENPSSTIENWTQAQIDIYLKKKWKMANKNMKEMPVIIDHKGNENPNHSEIPSYAS